MNKIFVSISIFSIFIGVYGRSAAVQGMWGEVRQREQMRRYSNEVEDEARAKKNREVELTVNILNYYNSNMKEILETEKLNSELTLKENIEKLELKVVTVKSLNAAKEAAKKLALKDKEYVHKQINHSNKLSLYEINEDQPFYIKDGTLRTEQVQHVDWDLNYSYEDVVTKYPELGLSTVRYYKFITLTKNKKEKSEELMFEKRWNYFCR